jgi:hypothetical protein
MQTAVASVQEHLPTRPGGKDLIAGILVDHWARPYTEEGCVLVVDCMGQGCGFQSSHVYLVGEDGMWAEHARHVAELLERAGVAETAGVAKAERLRLADKLDEEAAFLSTQRRSAETVLGWTQAAAHLRHPTATA